MKQVSAGVRIKKSMAEKTRRFLIAERLYAQNLKPVSDGDFMIFPAADGGAAARAASECEGAEAVTCEFEARVEAREPARHELIGGIAVMQDDDPAEAEYLLKSRPSIHTVLHSESPVSGEYRIKEFKVLAGVNTTRTEYLEYGKRFYIDLAAAYFSARLSNERQRVLGMMTDGERVLDMFAGVGPFSIVLAEKASVVFAGDINPAAIALMRENVAKNRCTNVVPMLADALSLGGIFPEHTFDRIIMNLPMTSTAFLETAFRLVKRGGTIHYYTLESEEGEMIPVLSKFTKGAVREHSVRSYSPTQHHAVYDIVHDYD